MPGRPGVRLPTGTRMSAAHELLRQQVRQQAGVEQLGADATQFLRQQRPLCEAVAAAGLGAALLEAGVRQRLLRMPAVSVAALLALARNVGDLRLLAVTLLPRPQNW